MAKAKAPAKPKIKKFKIASGFHREGGKNIPKGKVISSTSDLDKMFKGKFKRLKSE